LTATFLQNSISRLSADRFKKSKTPNPIFMKNLNQIREFALMRIDRLEFERLGIEDVADEAANFDETDYHHTVLAMCDRLDQMPSLAVASPIRNFTDD
jgi:hypothetical protein